MNERIKQLALAAFQPINDMASEGIADRHTFNQAWFQLYNQKFAELIVQDSADFIANMGGWCGGHGEPHCPSPIECAQKLKQRYGVK